MVDHGMKGAGRGSGSKANLKCDSKGSRGGKTGSKGYVGRSKGNAKNGDRSTRHPNISSNSECGSDLLGKGKSGGKVKGFGPTPSDAGKCKGKGAAHEVRLRLAAQDRYSEPKCVMILQQRYGCEVGQVLDIEGQSKDGRNWLEARHGGRTLPKSHEGIGWKKLHGDVEKPKLIRGLHGAYGCDSEVKLRVEGESEDHRCWLTECGREIEKSFIHVYWECTDSSSEEDDANCHDSSHGYGDGQRSLGSEDGFDPHVPSSDGLSDAFYDHERFPEYLRDERPDLDSDGLEDLYQGMLQDDAEEFGGYQCDSD
eukprot:TRINITY_DN70532_c0_g1_i1.p1 TRINITY_DN70532_c0_g1~~TRINITY_DN70532_c0_g1_i1.p1  ORF type:complete len:311 (-),score=39.65 TRINITY_DN70532_c0_g1_i1:95-1027(-)